MDLTTVARCKEYLGINTPATDVMIRTLITRASGQIAKFCTARFDHQHIVNFPMNGNDSNRIFMPSVPVVNVSSLTIDGQSIPASSDGIQGGYQFDDRMIYLFGGYCFTRGFRNVVVSYEASYTASEVGTIPTSGDYVLTPSTASDSDGSGFPFADLGVTFNATGLALTPVASAPASGQYAFSGGAYTFNQADNGKTVTMNYDYIPGSVEQACIEMVGLKIKQRDNIGVQSRTMANETVTYTDRDMTRSVQGLLTPYNRRIPV
jgi:hypothetical protein